MLYVVSVHVFGCYTIVCGSHTKTTGISLTLTIEVTKHTDICTITIVAALLVSNYYYNNHHQNHWKLLWLR